MFERPARDRAARGERDGWWRRHAPLLFDQGVPAAWDQGPELYNALVDGLVQPVIIIPVAAAGLSFRSQETALEVSLFVSAYASRKHAPR